MIKISDLRKTLSFIVLLGVPGSGKNKKGQILFHLAEAFGLRRIVMSGVIEKHWNHKTELGRQFEAEKSIKDGGGLMSDAPVIAALEQEILDVHSHGGNVIVLDGFPRNIEQLGHLRTWRIPANFFYLDINNAVSLQRVEKRAMEEGPRPDDPSAPDRFKLLDQNNTLILRKMKLVNPHCVFRIDGTLPVRDQITRIIRPVFRRHEVSQMMTCLDTPDHPARMIIDQMESKTHGGATAHLDAVKPTCNQKIMPVSFTEMAAM